MFSQVTRKSQNFFDIFSYTIFHKAGAIDIIDRKRIYERPIYIFYAIFLLWNHADQRFSCHLGPNCLYNYFTLFHVRRSCNNMPDHRWCLHHCGFRQRRRSRRISGQSVMHVMHDGMKTGIPVSVARETAWMTLFLFAPSRGINTGIPTLCSFLAADFIGIF